MKSPLSNDPGGFWCQLGGYSEADPPGLWPGLSPIRYWRALSPAPDSVSPGLVGPRPRREPHRAVCPRAESKKVIPTQPCVQIMSGRRVRPWLVSQAPTRVACFMDVFSMPRLLFGVKGAGKIGRGMV